MPPGASQQQHDRILNRAMVVSLVVGAAMLVTKTAAYVLTSSAAILSDASESVVHVVAVAFAAYSLSVSSRRFDRTHPFGYDRITFFSAGFEGAMIVLAAIAILIEAGRKFVEGPNLSEVGLGTIISGTVLVVNGALGWWLIVTGRRRGSLVVEADGRHVLTDSITSGAVLAGLLLVLFFPRHWIVVRGWTFDPAYFDPAFAIVAAGNILFTGTRLVRTALSGLMDRIAPSEERRIEGLVREACRSENVGFHEARFRNSGNRYWIQFHVLFEGTVTLVEAHRRATRIEQRLQRDIPNAVVTTHLETLGDHAAAHDTSGTAH